MKFFTQTHGAYYTEWEIIVTDHVDLELEYVSQLAGESLLVKKNVSDLANNTQLTYTNMSEYFLSITYYIIIFDINE